MPIARRTLLQAALAAGAGIHATPALAFQFAEGPNQIRDLLAQWDELGWQWTGTSVELASAEWLARGASAAGLDVAIERYPFERVEVTQCGVSCGNNHALGLPLFDAGSTAADGFSGTFTRAGDDGDIAVLELAPWDSGRELLNRTLLDARYLAVVAVTRGNAAGLAPLDCGNPLRTKSGMKPVVQISSEHREWIFSAAHLQSPGRVTAQFQRVSAEGRNVVAVWSGSDRKLPPIVVLAGRSGWGPCVGERGGGLVCLLEAGRALSRAASQRTVIFAATSGCELGAMGRAVFTDRYPNLAREAVGWIELGANLGARAAVVQISGSSPEWSRALQTRLTIEGAAWTPQVPGIPSDSTATGVVLAASPAPALPMALVLEAPPATPFHLPADQLPVAIDLAQLRALSRAFSSTLLELTLA